MDDAQSTTTAPVAETADSAPSTTEQAPETDDVELEDIELSEADIEDTDEADTPDEESQASDESEEESTDDTPDESKKDKSDDEAQRKDRARQAYEQRQQARTERDTQLRDRQLRETAENVRLEQYLKEAQGDEAELRYRQAEVERLLNQRERVAMNEERLYVGIERAKANIDLFRTGSPEVQEEFRNAVDDFIAMHVRLNKNGDPVEVTGDISEFLQKKADSIRRIQGVGVRQAVKDKQAVKARTVPLPSRAPKEPKVDQDIKDFDDAWN